MSVLQIGEYLGENKEPNLTVLKRFVELFEFQKMDIVTALRQFLGKFRLPGEAQKVRLSLFFLSLSLSLSLYIYIYIYVYIYIYSLSSLFIFLSPLSLALFHLSYFLPLCIYQLLHNNVFLCILVTKFCLLTLASNLLIL